MLELLFVSEWRKLEKGERASECDYKENTTTKTACESEYDK
jgi:hypothetical protein